MTITYIGVNSAASTATTITVSQPTETQIGDALIVAVEIESGTSNLGTPNPNTWNILGSFDQGSNQGIRVYWRFATAAGSSSYSFATGGKKTSAGLVALRGTNPTTPFISGGANSGTTGTMTAPSINNDVVGNWLLTFFGTKLGSVAHTVPSGMTQRYLTAAVDFRSSGNTQQLTSTGATGTKSSSTSSDSWVGVSVLALDDVVEEYAQLKAWNGSTWVVGDLKRWTGTRWGGTEGKLKRWNGTTWVETPPQA
jgi:hypothetical protein